MRRLLGLLAMATEVMVSVIGEAIDFWGSGLSREDLQAQVRKHASHAERLQYDLDDARATIADLESANEGLVAENDQLIFNGPTLYSDEVDALRYAQRVVPYGNGEAIRRLLGRSDKFPNTFEEIFEMVDEAIRADRLHLNNKQELHDWMESLPKESAE